MGLQLMPTQRETYNEQRNGEYSDSHCGRANGGKCLCAIRSGRGGRFVRMAHGCKEGHYTIRLTRCLTDVTGRVDTECLVTIAHAGQDGA